MSGDDKIRIQHMLDSANEAVNFSRHGSLKELENDHLLALGLVKCIEIIGEAASRIGEDTKNLHQSIPWPQIVAMRNRLVHVYFDIDLDQVWQTVTVDLPPLIGALEKILTELRD